MKLIKLGLISFFILFAIVTAFSLLLPSTVIVSRATNISASADSAFSYLNDVSCWKSWLEIIDSSDSKISSPSQGKGAIIISNNTKAEIISSNENQVKTTWQVNKGEIMIGEFNLIKQKNAEHFTIQWSFTQHIAWYPWEKFASILSDKALGPFMERSLDKLKLLIENKN